jgi:hypothetical protein
MTDVKRAARPGYLPDIHAQSAPACNNACVARIGGSIHAGFIADKVRARYFSASQQRPIQVRE